MRINRGNKPFGLFLIFISLMGFVAFLEYSRGFAPHSNILLVSIDCLRPDHLGCYGYKRKISPNIDRLAKEGVLFSQVIAQGSWTLPSLHAVITSTYTSTNNVYFLDQSLSNAIPTLPEVLARQRNYYTVFLSNHGGLPRTFKSRFHDFNDSPGRADEVTGKAITCFKNNSKRAFFVWIHYMDTHDRLIGVPEEKHFIKNITGEEIDKYTLEYDKAISYIDSQIGVLIDKLKAMGLYQNTLIIITSDHGQEMCEHNICFNHGGSLWDSEIRVPLIISYPRLLPKNKIILSQAQHIDIAPTVCDILNIQKPKRFEGVSRLPLMKENRIQSTYGFSEHQENEKDLSTGSWIYTKFSIRTPEWKLIKTIYKEEKEEYELYNLKNDPQEKNNLVGIEKGKFKLLEAKLEEWVNRPKPKIDAVVMPLDEKNKERLKSLGYLQ